MNPRLSRRYVARTRVSQISVESFPSVAEALLSHMQEGFLVAWLFHALVFGRVENGQIVFPGFSDAGVLDKFLIRVRLFNQDQEVYLYRSSNVVAGRFREDFRDEQLAPEDSTETLVKDLDGVLLGRARKDLNGSWMTVSSQRGSRFVVPVEWTSDEHFRLRVHLRYYIGYVNHLAGFVDQRIIGIGRGERRE